MKTWKTPKLKKLAHALVRIQHEKDMLAFLRDVATIEELDSLSSRWQAAQLIHQGMPYRKIAAKTGLSTATVTRVAHWLHHGEGGYEKAINFPTASNGA